MGDLSNTADQKQSAGINCSKKSKRKRRPFSLYLNAKPWENSVFIKSDPFETPALIQSLQRQSSDEIEQQLATGKLTIALPDIY